MSNTLDPRFRPFTVLRKVRESSTITSFYLEPIDPTAWRPFEAGQFLTVQISDPKSGEPVIRNYTVSSAPSDEGVYRITVKRETSLKPGVPNGIVSCWLHDTVKEGAIVHIDGPRGAFKLNKVCHKPVIPLSGGVGLTPTVSMLKVLVREGDAAVAQDNCAVSTMPRPGRLSLSVASWACRRTRTVSFSVAAIAIVSPLRWR
jgi:ferredoxin-NADP reductase